MSKFDEDDLDRNTMIKLLLEVEKEVKNLPTLKAYRIINTCISKEYEREARARRLAQSWDDELTACNDIIRKKVAVNEKATYYKGVSKTLRRLIDGFWNAHIAYLYMTKEDKEYDDYAEENE